MATIKDIAELVGVSPSTVSRVLKYDQNISVAKDTRARIFKAAEELNYTKHIEKIMHTQSQIILVQWYDENQELDDIYYFSIRMGIEKICERDNIMLIRKSLTDLADVSEQTIGVIALGKFGLKEIEQMKSAHPNVLLIDCDGTRYGVNSVVVDFEAGVSLAVEDFLQREHHKIGILYGEEYNRQNELIPDKRYQAFRQLMSIKKMYRKELVYAADFTVEGAYSATKQFLARASSFPTALFVASDAMALGAIKAIKEADLMIPENIELISFNDSSIAKYVSPALSAIRVHTEWMGELSVLMLEQFYKLQPPVAQKIMIEPTLIKRETTK